MIQKVYTCDRCEKQSEGSAEDWVEIISFAGHEEDDVVRHYCGYECAMFACAEFDQEAIR